MLPDFKWKKLRQLANLPVNKTGALLRKLDSRSATDAIWFTKELYQPIAVALEWSFAQEWTLNSVKIAELLRQKKESKTPLKHYRATIQCQV